MSTSTQIYTGAYLELKFNPIPREEIIIICQNHPNIKYKKSDKFCSICGWALKPKTTIITEEMDWSDLLNEDEQKKYEDELLEVLQYNKSVTYLIGNNNIPNCPDSIEGDDIGEEAIEILPEMITTYRQNFKNIYREFISLIEPQVKSLKIKFGILIYYN